MTIQQTLSEIKARADKATAGPWALDDEVPTKFERDYYKTSAPFLMKDASPHDVILCGEIAAKNPADTDFIAAARTDVPALVRALEKAIEQRNYHMDNMRLGTECQEKENAELTAILTSGQKGAQG